MQVFANYLQVQSYRLFNHHIRPVKNATTMIAVG